MKSRLGRREHDSAPVPAARRSIERRRRRRNSPTTFREFSGHTSYRNPFCSRRETRNRCTCPFGRSNCIDRFLSSPGTKHFACRISRTNCDQHAERRHSTRVTWSERSAERREALFHSKRPTAAHDIHRGFSNRSRSWAVWNLQHRAFFCGDAASDVVIVLKRAELTVRRPCRGRGRGARSPARVAEFETKKRGRIPAASQPTGNCAPAFSFKRFDYHQPRPKPTPPTPTPTPPGLTPA